MRPIQNEYAQIKTKCLLIFILEMSLREQDRIISPIWHYFRWNVKQNMHFLKKNTSKLDSKPLDVRWQWYSVISFRPPLCKVRRNKTTELAAIFQPAMFQILWWRHSADVVLNGLAAVTSLIWTAIGCVCST